MSRRVTGAQARSLFLTAPWPAPGHGGVVILDSHGDLVWMEPNTTTARKIDFNTQIYRGEPHLTWWEGVQTHFWGQGEAVVADSSYRRTHTIRAVGRGLKLDHHEFHVTAQNTALVTIFKIHSGVDLRPVGGPRRGVVASGVCQEIDIATGKLLFEWDSLDHVPISETNEPFAGGTAANPYDYFHINSIDVTPDGDLLISSRNTWTLYKVGRRSGRIIWRMNGKRSDFTIGHGAHFYWQHHARLHGAGGTLSIFDNGAAPVKEKQSRAIVLHVDTSKMHVRLVHQYHHPRLPLLAKAMGSAQLLPDGRMFVGWGTQPYFSEFTADGRLVMEGTMGQGHPSYRTFVADWTGHPVDRPAVAARHRSGGATVYASWNGATNVASWTVLAGGRRNSLVTAGSAHRAGFETAMAVRHAGPFFAVRAHDAKGHVLATSATVKVK